MSTRRFRLIPRAGGSPRTAATFGAAALIAAILLSPEPLAAQTSPSAAPCPEATLVVPAGAGSGSDLIARDLASAANRVGAKPPIVVRNIDGNAGIDGADTVRRAPGDGCTMLFAHQGLLANFLSWKAPFAWHEFRHAALVTRTPMVLVASVETPSEDLATVFDAARSGSVSFAVGDGDVSTFAMRALAEAGDVDFSFDTVEGGRDRIIRLLDGSTDLIVVPTALAQRLAETGKVNLLAVTDIDRSNLLPDVPTLEEQGVGYNHAIDLGILLPSTTPTERVREIADLFGTALEDPALIRSLDGYDVRIDYRPMTRYTVYWENLMAVWREMAVEAGYRRASR